MAERITVNSKKPVSIKENLISHKRKTDFRSNSSPVNRILYLQRTIGNQAVQRMVRSGALQAKLRIGQPGDVYEQEADRVADAVMRMPEPGVQRQADLEEEEEEILQTKPLVDQITPLVQRQVEEEEEEEMLQAKSREDATPEVTNDLESQINAIKGGGRPLSRSERSFFKPRIGADFSNVRVHNDTLAASAARLVNARAFTVGHNVVFGAGEYSPDASTGRKLLAHELTHVVQQNGGSTLFSKGKNFENTVPNSQELSAVSPELQRTIGDGHDLSAPWLAGDAMLEAIYDNERLMRNGSRGTAVKKVQQLLFYLDVDFPTYGADGIFGGETETAVKEFQRANVDEAGTQLVGDGTVGHLTMGALNREANRTGTNIGDLIRTSPIPALQGPPTASPTPLSVDRIDVVDSAAGAIAGYPDIVGNADLNTPGPFNDAATGEASNVHQIHFHLDNSNSASLTPRRELQRSAFRAGRENQNPTDQPLPPGVIGPPNPGGFDGILVGPDGPPPHEIQRPTADTIVIADAPGSLRTPAADYPYIYRSHFILTVEDASDAPIARIKYDVRIERRNAGDVPNTENRIVVTEKKDFVRGRNL